MSRLTPGHEFLWYLVAMDNSTDEGNDWVADYVAMFFVGRAVQAPAFARHR